MAKYTLSIFLFLIFATSASANTTGYAWSESLGWFDFSNAVVTDTALTGHAYNDNTGWLVLGGVTNTNGTLSGYAWSESVGYFDFSDVYIESNSLKGYAYNDNTGFLSFDTGTTITTTWTQPVDAPTPEPRRSSSSGGSKKKVILKTPTTFPSVNTPTTVPSIFAPTFITSTLSSNPRDLELNIEGEDVKLLQQFLNGQGFTVNTPGLPGSSGYETNFFGNLTRQALTKFQIKHNITPSAGYFGPKTRAFIKTLQN